MFQNKYVIPPDMRFEHFRRPGTLQYFVPCAGCPSACHYFQPLWRARVPSNTPTLPRTCALPPKPRPLPNLRSSRLHSLACIRSPPPLPPPPRALLRRSEYDQGVNTFSPDGRLFQVEYAIEAIKLGTTAVGIQTSEGVVLAVEKRLASKLIEPSSIEKIWEIDSHIGCAVSGLTADARQLVDHARVEAQNHRFTFNEPMNVHSVVQSVCDLKISFGEGREEGDVQNKPSRPFGVALLVAGVDKDGTPSLYSTDPSGTYLQYDAKAIGSGSEGAETVLKEVYHKSLTLDEARKVGGWWQ